MSVLGKKLLTRLIVSYVLHVLCQFVFLAHKAPNTTIDEFANTVDPDETAHNEPSHLDPQCLPNTV